MGAMGAGAAEAGAADEPVPGAPAPAPEPAPPPGTCACTSAGRRSKMNRRNPEVMQNYPETYTCKKEKTFRCLKTGGMIAFFPSRV